MTAPSTMSSTRRALHAVAELLIAGPQYAATGDIRLAARPGGFGGVTAGSSRGVGYRSGDHDGSISVARQGDRAGRAGWHHAAHHCATSTRVVPSSPSTSCSRSIRRTPRCCCGPSPMVTPRCAGWPLTRNRSSGRSISTSASLWTRSTSGFPPGIRRSTCRMPTSGPGRFRRDRSGISRSARPGRCRNWRHRTTSCGSSTKARERSGRVAPDQVVPMRSAQR